jgi:hypothetical protein
MVILPAGTGNLSRDRTTRRNPLAAPQTAKSRADHRGGETTDFFQSFRRKTGGSVYAKTNAGQDFSLTGVSFCPLSMVVCPLQTTGRINHKL